MKINPDILTVENIDVPANYFGGWTDGKISIKEAVYKENKRFGELQEDMHIVFKTRAARAIPDYKLTKWNDFSQAKGRYPGSCDWTLLEDFVHGQPLYWLPQGIGSCVISNTFRGIVLRTMYEIALLGELEEYLGRNEFGVNNYASYAPWSYGMARRRANMRGGDGLYCSAMVESLTKDGLLPCSTEQLIKICNSLGVGNDNDFPEPQNERVYRAFGDWQYLDELKPYADYQLLECPMVNSADQLWSLLEQGKTTFVCSGEAIHKVGEHKDGFPIHAVNTKDTWAHNMGVHGGLVASDGDKFFRWSNRSWGPEHIYNRAFDEVDRSFRAGKLTMAAIGDINGLKSSPLTI